MTMLLHSHAVRCAPLARPARLTRRTFLTAGTALLSSGLAARFTPSVWAQPLGANSDIRVAVIGLNQKGALLTRQVLAMPGVRLTALCDVDPRILAREVNALKARRIPLFATTDARQLMARSDIDAVVIATSDHWHALLTVWACQAGKDVYVEKPVCHTVWEGEKMWAAATKYGRIVQAGTQSRSDPGVAEAVAAIRGGELGRIQWIHALCYRLREGIGRALPWYPDWLDYDLYCGPAPMAPLERRDLHYDWHWHWPTGGGDLANIGVHQFDIARWFAGNPPFPPKVLSLGGRFAVDDAGETPNTQLALYADPEIPILFEIRGRPAKPGVKFMDQTRGIREGVVVQCEHGYFAGFVGGALFDHAGRRLKTIKGDGGGGHMANFLAAVRSRRTSDLAAPLVLGRDSSVGCLLGNISYRLGAPASLAEAQRQLADFPTAVEVLDSLQIHLAAHGVDLARTPLTLGRWLNLDRTSADVVSVTGENPAELARAQFLRKGSHRPPYTIPAVI